MLDKDLKKVLESLLFVCDEPLSARRAAEVIGEPEAAVNEALDELRVELENDGRGIQLREVAGGYRFYTHPAHAPFVEKLVLSWDSRRLTQAALETLAVIAYKQPVTKADISTIRGVSADGAVASLLAKGLVKEVGREKSPGAPILYGTTAIFLEKFGYNSLAELPPLADFEPDPAIRGEIESALKSETGEVVDEGETTAGSA